MSGPNAPYTSLDQQQVLQQAFDPTKDRIRVDAELTSTIIPPPGLEVSISAVDDNIAIRNSNNTNELLVNADGSINVDASISSSSIQLFTKAYDSITVTYPIATQEVYKSRVGGILGIVQETVTVNYVDSTKINLLNVART